MPENAVLTPEVQPEPEQSYEDFVKARFATEEPKEEPSETAPVEEPVKTEPESETGNKQESEEPAKDAPKDKKKGGFQRRIDRLVEKNRALEAELAAVAGRKQETKQEQRQDLPVAKIESSGKPRLPRIEEFKDLDAYHASMEDYLEKRDLWNQEQREKTEREKREKAESEKLALSWQVKEHTAASKYEDFEDVTRNPRLPITNHMFQAMQETELGAEILYWLGTHPGEAGRIAQLSPTSQIRELGKIEDKLGTPATQADSATPITPETRKPPASSRAPEPVSPVASRAKTAEKSPDEETFQEFLQRRNRQLGRR
jgi:hypothetical protein